MFQIQGCPARAVALVRFHGDLSEADFVGLIGLAASAGVAWNYIFDFTAVERADLAADYVAKLGELPQLFTDRQRICVVPQADLRLVRLFAAYQTSKGWRPPEIVDLLEDAFVRLDVQASDFTPFTGTPPATLPGG
ncbi:MAG: hypothetical protein JO339_00765 [Alphaproteobacteria bacterium]|nr:hypothetical protein [Alphaproteobacteria bacterium]